VTPAHLDPARIPGGETALLRALLPRVSRTFALGIRLLPPELSRSVTIAYLLCRIADTIEDHDTLPAATRQALLAQFAGWLREPPAEFSALLRHFPQPDSDHQVLVSQVERVLEAYRRLPGPVQAAIRPPVEEMCAGMAEYAGRGTVDGASAQPADLADLERYCWYVAGTVGWLLTDLFRLADGRWGGAEYARLRELSRGFGLGLQLTNVIRDIGEDHARGVTYLPADLCHAHGVRPSELFAPARAAQTAAIIGTLADRAEEHLRAGGDYILALPRRSYRVRLFCLVPLLLAIRTLGRVRAEPAYASGWVRVKLTRAAVRAVVMLSVVIAPSNGLIRGAFRWLGGAPRPSAA